MTAYRVTVTAEDDVLYVGLRFGDWLNADEVAADTVQAVATAHGRRTVELSVSVDGPSPVRRDGAGQ